LVRQLAESGVEATPSAMVIELDQKLDKETIAAEARKLGVDAVMVTHLVGVVEETIYFPSETYLVPHGYYRRFYRYYPVYYDYVYEPGYYHTYTYVKLETNLYDAASEELIWSVTSETIELRTVNKMMKSLGRAIIKSLRQNGLIRQN